MSAGRRRGLALGILIMLLGPLLAVLTPTGAQAATVTSAVPDAALNQAWNAYGDAGGHWTGADSTASVLLPDGRIAWLYSDTFLGTVNADHSRARTTPMINNSIVVQSGTTYTTLTGGTAAAPESLVGPSTADEWRWVADGTVTGNNLQVFYNTYHRTGTGTWDFKLSGTELATFSLPDLTLRGTVAMPLGSRVAWGMAVTEQSDYTYVYGTEMSAPTKYVHVARARTGQLWDAWEFWNGTAWSPTEASSARLVSGVGSSFSVDRIDGRYILVTKDDTVSFGANVVAYFATSPNGPFTEQTYLYRAPEAAGSVFVYDARLHPELSTPGKLVISYNVNSLTSDDNYRDARIYRPRFIDVALSSAPPDPSTLPPAPVNLRATAGDGQATLSWDSAGTGLWYWIYRRDTTAGQTEYARLAYPVAGGTSVTVGGLSDNHEYEFQVSAINELGEGPRSAALKLTATATPPPAPAGLTATARTDGQIDLAWTAAARANHYWIYQRDVTDGETAFTKLSLPASGTKLTAGLLINAHVYEFRVTGVNGGGEGPVSNTAQATSVYVKPAAPTGLTAVARGDASVALTWTPPGENLWYWIYQRDVTAGETTFTKLTYPATSPSATPGGLLPGHVYEFTVAAINSGGDGPQSAAVQATARMDLPGTPTGLTAVARGDASVALTWTAPGENLWYWIYQRDVTAAEADFTKLAYPATSPSATPGGLLPGHVYEYKVAAINSGGDGPATAPVTVTARVDAPAAPTGLVAAAGDGKVTLTWNYPQADAWFWVYTRDVTAGDTTFSRSGYPVAAATTVTLGPLANDHLFEFQVAAVDQGTEGARSAVATATPVAVKPAAPTNLTATANADSTVKLAWTEPAGNNWYWAYWRDVTAGETTFVRGGYPIDGSSVTVGPFTHNHTYEFKVSAISGSGEGPASIAVSTLARYAVPGAPANVRAVVAGDGVVNLSWDEAGTQLYYYIYRRDVTAGETGFTKAVYPTDQTQITLSALINAHTYEYRVSGVSPGGEGPLSAVASVVARTAVPRPPTALAAAPGNAEVRLTWTASVTGSVYYWIEKRDVTAGTGFVRLDWPVDGTAVTIGALTNGHTYDFRVIATNTAGDSTPATVSGKPMPPLPGAPPVLNQIAVDGAVGLGWTAGSNATSYVVEYRDVTGGQSAWTRSKALDGFALTVKSLTNGHSYDFRVKGINVTGEGPASPTVRATPLPALPKAPSGLSATAGNAQVKLSWTASTSPDVHYWVYYKADSWSSWYYLESPVSGTSVTVKKLANGFNYQFRVTAANVAGQSPASNTVSARPVAPLPQAPSGLVANAGDAQVKLTWTASSTPDVYYWVYYKAQGWTDWYFLKSPVSGTSATVKSLVNGYSYSFKVTAANDAGQSAATAVVSVKPLPPLPSAPAGLTGSIVDDPRGFSTVKLKWQHQDGLYYWVYQRRKGTPTWIRGYPTTEGSAEVVPRWQESDVEFLIRAENITGLGPISNIVTMPLYSRTAQFRRVADFIAAEMTTNSNSLTVKAIWAANQSLFTKVDAYALWAWKVRPKGDWDHKVDLRDMLNMPSDNSLQAWTRTPTYEDQAVFFDVWSNIHYGYVGCQAGFFLNELLLGQASPGAGESGENFDPGDLRSVRIGYAMCDPGSKYVSPGTLTVNILNNLDGWRGNGKVRDWVSGMN